MAEYRAIKIEKGSGGFGGPLTEIGRASCRERVFRAV